MPEMTFTTERIRGLEPPDSGQRIVYDAKTKGLAIRLTQGSKTFIVERWSPHLGKTVRVKICPVGDLSLSQARAQAQKLIADIARGLDPNAERRRQQQEAITLAQVLEMYLKARHLRPSTAAAYRAVMRNHLADLAGQPWAALSPELIAQRHAQIGQTMPLAANQVSRVLVAVLRWAREHFDADGPDPAKKLRKAWYAETPRTRHLAVHQIGPFWRATETLDPTARDYLQLLLLTGLRRQEAARLTWKDVNLDAATLTVPAAVAKNGKAHCLPLPVFLHQMLLGRRSLNTTWVFAKRDGSGPMDDPRAAFARIARQTGLQVSCHDLRRSFATLAESLDLSWPVVQKLLNHSLPGTTARYTVVSPERLRVPMEQISRRILALAESNVVAFPRAGQGA